MPTSPRNPKVDAYAKQAEAFAQPILRQLRDIIHAACPETVEDIRYGIPHFSYRGDYICIFAAYKSHCSFTFYKDALMKDARLKANSGLPAAKRFMGKMTSVADLPATAELASWLKEAMALNEAGAKLPTREPKTPKDVVMPAVFAAALKADQTAKAIFESKSPSFRKEYNVWIGDAKTDATRNKRIEEAVTWIAEGKGRFWKSKAK
ncbi:MAG: hypothetical protein HOP09_12570 [Hyphomicrobium sp.]|nr:hypothetical protein [Hyphomicrobium sp.]